MPGYGDGGDGAKDVFNTIGIQAENFATKEHLRRLFRGAQPRLRVNRASYLSSEHTLSFTTCWVSDQRLLQLRDFVEPKKREKPQIFEDIRVRGIQPELVEAK